MGTSVRTVAGSVNSYRGLTLVDRT